ncbi:MAG: deoxyribonuclease IV, partial [Bryobacterales bacterium]|nr:deoxyribonuclease IV [Bryobacterales bacterium]
MTHRLGAHVSVAGSLLKATEEAVRIGANTIQIFTSSPRMWRASQLNPQQVKAFRAAREHLDIQPLAIHDNYLINLAAADDEIWLKSGVAMRGELERAIQLDADYLVAHPGSFREQTVDSAIAAFAESLEAATEGVDVSGVTLLLECTAGQGSSLGRRLEELAMLRAAAAGRTPLPVGFCLDTCHLF